MVTDLNGRLVKQVNEVTDHEQYKKDIDLTNFTSGAYFVNINFEGKSVSKKIIVQ